jgi:general secretion pathway protein I
MGISAVRDEAGFTLLEMLVALSILAVAALTLVRLDAFALRTAADLDETSLAAVVAQNRAVEIWTDPQLPTIGNFTSMEENGGRNWRIEQRVTRTDDPNVLRIDLRVQPVTGRGQAVLTLVRRGAL